MLPKQFQVQVEELKLRSSLPSLMNQQVYQEIVLLELQRLQLITTSVQVKFKLDKLERLLPQNYILLSVCLELSSTYLELRMLKLQSQLTIILMLLSLKSVIMVWLEMLLRLFQNLLKNSSNLRSELILLLLLLIFY